MVTKLAVGFASRSVFGKARRTVSITGGNFCSRNPLSGKPRCGSGNHKFLAAKLSKFYCDGIFVAGSTGDMPFLLISERVELVKAACAGMPDSTVLYGGIGDFSFRDHIENAKRFADAGCDVAVMMTPIIFFGLAQSEVAAYFEEIAGKSPIPIVLYHHMRVTTPIEPETVASLSLHPNIIV